MRFQTTTLFPHEEEMEPTDQIETLERGLVVAGLEALKQVGGDALVHLVLGQAGKLEFSRTETLPDRVPLDEYLHYRDAAMDFLRESFRMTAFQAGQIMIANLRNTKANQIKRLVEQFKYSANKLPAIGQAAVLAASGNPGFVKAAMKSEELLVITIENCPECRGLEERTPFCFLNQGVITEFALSYLDLRVNTQETSCIAMGAGACETEVRIEQ
jgi:hypothetical protein